MIYIFFYDFTSNLNSFKSLKINIINKIFEIQNVL